MKGLIDSTLREGLQTVGVNLRRNQKINILCALAKTGIEEIELGIATRADNDLPHLLSLCRHDFPKAAISLWSRCLKDDIVYASKLHPNVLSLSIPASDLHIEKKLKKDRKWVVQTLKESISIALQYGIPKVSVGFEDATRADSLFLNKLAKISHDAGAFRIRIADTVGIATPAKIANIIQTLMATCPIQIGVHTHNDFGMGTANAVAALEAGADWADVSVLGLGERTGCARFEEVAGFLAINQGRNYNVAEIPKLSQLVAKYSNQPISTNRPIVGSEIFACETGLHLLGLEEDPQTYEPYHPEHVGAKRKLIYGAKIGRKNILQRFAKLNTSVSLTKIDQLFFHVRKKAPPPNEQR